jgi:hypothetical protein
VFLRVSYDDRARYLQDNNDANQRQETPHILKLPYTPSSKGVNVRESLTLTPLPKDLQSRIIVAHKKSPNMAQLLCPAKFSYQPPRPPTPVRTSVWRNIRANLRSKNDPAKPS